MELELQKYFQQLQSNVAAQAKHWIPTPSKLNFESVSSALVVMVGFWLTATIVQSLVQKFFKARQIDEALSRFLQRVLRLAILALGMVTALGTLGVDVSGIVAGLGLTGLALGVAMKDAVSNAVSGVMLLIFRPFRHRDHIKVADFEGEVIDIDMRYTHLHTTDHVIFIPNSLLFANAVTVTKAALVKPEPKTSSSTAGEPAIGPPTQKPARRKTLLALVADDADSAAA